MAGVQHHPRRNRVNPFGLFEAVAEKGLMHGNRGDLHRADGTISDRRWSTKAWICCSLTRPNGGSAIFDTKGHYTPLFFLDEATALAAGHRPCAYCRRPAYIRFKTAWVAAGLGVAKAVAIDAVLHAARIRKDGKTVFRSASSGLPDGTMVVTDETPDRPCLVLAGALRVWTHQGYGGSLAMPSTGTVRVLTPAPLVRVLAAGYEPVIHPSGRS